MGLKGHFWILLAVSSVCYANHTADTPFLPSKDTCGSVNSSDRIKGGDATGLLEFPWMALLKLQLENGRGAFICGGVLINPRYILTAAHCIKGKDVPISAKLASVRLGEYNTDNDTDCIYNGKKNVCAPPPLDIPVEESIAHEMYNPYDINQYHDIGLLRLAREVKSSEFVRTICLPISTFDQSKEFIGQNLTVAGWGITENNESSPVKLKVNVPVRSNSDCKKTYRKANVNLSGGQLCAGGVKDKDSCQGDSGGPLMSLYATEYNKSIELNYHLIGVVSFGPMDCGKENWPAVYTKVAHYIPWIVGKLRA